MDSYFVFKFHYVSINSQCEPDIIRITMDFKFHYVSINSISPDPVTLTKKHFKFHYVSINSPRSWNEKCISTAFKFHYVSINSFIVKAGLIAASTLNSIMFLLIHQYDSANDKRYLL